MCGHHSCEQAARFPYGGEEGLSAATDTTNIKLVFLGEGVTSKKRFLVLNLVKSNSHSK